jgi:hypothetical protein
MIVSFRHRRVVKDLNAIYEEQNLEAIMRILISFKNTEIKCFCFNP